MKVEEVLFGPPNRPDGPVSSPALEATVSVLAAWYQFVGQLTDARHFPIPDIGAVLHSACLATFEELFE